ncbi:MAG: 30S ribosomal protein S20 [Deltaproteobacteria bacterium]|nr:30S ribosomal protein S20 [Deltaproteobacteria bacterium]
MATHGSAIKRHRQSEKRRLRNRSVKSAARSAVKDLRKAVEAKNREEAVNLFKKASSVLDMAVTKGVLHRNNASRRISRLSAAINSIPQG